MTEQDYALLLLLRNLLEDAIRDDLRVNEKAAYSADARFEMWQGHARLHVESHVAPAVADASLAHMLRAYERLRGGSTQEAAWERARERALAPFLRGNRTPSALYGWLEGTLWQRDTFSRFPPVTEIVRATGPDAFARWIEERIEPYGRRIEVERSTPAGVAFAGFLALGAVAGALLASRRMRSRVDLARLRYVARIRISPAIVGLVCVPATVLGIAAWVPMGRAYLAVGEVGARFDSAVAHAVAEAVPIAAAAIALLLAAQVVPRKLLLLEHELRVKSFGARSRGFPWAEVGAIERCRGWDAARLGGLGCLPLTLGLLRHGVCLRLGPGRALFVHTRDDDELVRIARELKERAAGRTFDGGVRPTQG